MPAASGPRGWSTTARQRTWPSRLAQMMCTPRREIRSGSPAGDRCRRRRWSRPLELPCARNDPEPSQAKARPSAAVTSASRPSRAERPSLPGESGDPRRPRRLDRGRAAIATASPGSTRSRPAGEPSGASIKRGGSVGSKVKPDGRLAGGIEDQQLRRSLVVTAAKPWGPIARSSTVDRNSCFQTQRPAGVSRPIRSRSWIKASPNSSGLMAR